MNPECPACPGFTFLPDNVLSKSNTFQRLFSRHVRPDERSILRLTEFIAVSFQLAYTWLYLQGSELCWPFAIAGSVLFAWVCLKKDIPAESLLYLFYIAMGVYGWVHTGGEWLETTWPLYKHSTLLVLSVFVWFAMAYYLRKKLRSAKPLADAFTTVFSVGATVLMVNAVHFNWFWWMIIDSVAIYLYFSRKLYLGSLLFLIYAVMAFDGFFKIGWFT